MRNAWRAASQPCVCTTGMEHSTHCIAQSKTQCKALQHRAQCVAPRRTYNVMHNALCIEHNTGALLHTMQCRALDSTVHIAQCIKHQITVHRATPNAAHSA